MSFSINCGRGQLSKWAARSVYSHGSDPYLCDEGPLYTHNGYLKGAKNRYLGANSVASPSHQRLKLWLT